MKILRKFKTKIMRVKSQKRDKPYIIYNNEPLECVESMIEYDQRQSIVSKYYT